MKKITKSEDGFHIIEATLIFIITGIVGSVGWYVWHVKNQTNKSINEKVTTSSTTNSKIGPKPTSEITDGPSGEWNTYTNNKLGFSIQIPKSFLSPHGGPCVKIDYVYDNYGNKVPSRSSYRPAEKPVLVPATVVEDGNNFYITEKYTYQLTNRTDDKSGHSYYDGCEKLDTSLEVVRGYQLPDSKYLLDMVPISIINVKDENDILSWARTFFKDETISIDSMKENSEGWQDVVLTCSSSNPCTDFNYKFFLKYYKKQQKLAYLALGQSGHLMKPNGNDFYSSEVVDSFKLLKN